MVRAFIDVFPAAVLLSGAESDLQLIGTTGPGIEIDPGRSRRDSPAAPDVRADLERIDLGEVREIVGTFVGAAHTLAAGTADAVPVTDDRPLQEYGVRSMLNFWRGVPSGIVDLTTWPHGVRAVSQTARRCPLLRGSTPISPCSMSHTAHRRQMWRPSGKLRSGRAVRSPGAATSA